MHENISKTDIGTGRKAFVGRSRKVASVIDLFCGAGALSHGFLLEGFSVACGYDADEVCRFAFETNNDTVFIRQDVAQLDPRDLVGEFAPDIARVLIGCAPCQPFSKYSQGRDDPKWRLLEDFGDLAVAVSPDVLSMENVPQLIRFKGGALFESFVSKLEHARYHVKWKTVECTDFGVPQSRSRLVLVASRHGEPKLPQPTHDQDHYASVWDTIRHLPPLEAGQVDPVDALHCATSMSEVNLKRIRASKPGGTWRDWDEALIADCHRRASGRTYPSVYGRMDWNLPAPTITTQFYGFGNGRFGHPEQDRAISLREGAMLQSFPRDYKFARSGEPLPFRRLGRMIGNAVPVALARAIARAIAEHLEDVHRAPSP